MPDSPAPLANVFTIGVRNFTAQRDFYRSMGWPQVVDDDNYAAFELRGAVLGLFPLQNLAADGNTEPAPIENGISFTIGIMTDSAEDVDRLVDRFRKAGARITKEPEDAEFFEGRSAYLADPEGNYFEVAWATSDNTIVAAARRAAGQ
ncbi:VOC family protein [Nonomuraea sp. NPDC049709]|uniref:VOC family protein n=1 Tax=Nonomuraea sp. NPDC049709 TaxID=3154736 RepID=UPI0034442C3B